MIYQQSLLEDDTSDPSLCRQCTDTRIDGSACGMRHAQHFTAFNRRDLADDCPPTGTPKTDDILSNDPPPLPSIIYRLLPMGNDGGRVANRAASARGVGIGIVWS